MKISCSDSKMIVPIMVIVMSMVSHFVHGQLQKKDYAATHELSPKSSKAVQRQSGSDDLKPKLRSEVNLKFAKFIAIDSVHQQSRDSTRRKLKYAPYTSDTLGISKPIRNRWEQN
jgi:hypothetical protein